MTPAEIEALLGAALPCVHLSVSGDGRHFEALIVSGEFAGKSRVARQQRVYQAVGERMARDEIHALSMQCLTPEEWAARAA